MGDTSTHTKDHYETAWIPEEYAAIGNTVKLKKDSLWDDGWEVMSIGTRKESKYVQEFLRDNHKHQRKASDI